MDDAPSKTEEKLSRTAVPALDAILGQRFQVLDDGFVRLIDYMGDDSAVVQAARVSYGAGTKKISDDRALIRYLLRHRHTTPFEMCEVKLHVRVPMDTWRQWIRHRTASTNEYSTRYSVAIDSAQRTEPGHWRLQSTVSKQGSSGFAGRVVGEALTAAEAKLQLDARAVYEERLQAGVAREQARKDLPLSTYTEAYWKVDLHNLLHFLALRMAPNAQYEIRAYAETIASHIVRAWCPAVWNAFEEYQLTAVNLSRAEADLIRAIATGQDDVAISIAAQQGWATPSGKPIDRSRERAEVEEKLERLGLVPPWSEGNQAI